MTKTKFLTKLREVQSLKRDVEPARWWASLVDADKVEMVGRVEVAWHQSSVYFPVVLRHAAPKAFVVYYDEVGSDVFFAEGVHWCRGGMVPLMFSDITVTKIAWPLSMK